MRIIKTPKPSSVRIVLWLTLLLISNISFSQDVLPVNEITGSIPIRFLEQVKQQSQKLERKLLLRTENALTKLAKREARLQRKLAKKDSLQAELLFGDVSANYRQLLESLKDTIASSERTISYLPHLDTLKTSLAFLSANSLGLSNVQTEPIRDALQSVQKLEGHLQKTEQIKKFLSERRALLKQQLSQFNLVRDFTRYNKQAYYYGQQLQEFKNVLENPDQLQQKAVSMLRELPAFQDFMKKHGALAGLFGIPGNYGSLESLAGLQTRAGVQSLIQERVASAGPNGITAFQQNIQAAQSQLSQLKDKLNEWGGSTDADMPDFKPNNQKTKTFLQRLEYGTNLQSQPSSNWFPSTTDIGLSVGYKLTDKSIVGIGASYKVGWGRDIQHIAITHQGVGLRSFVDVKLKGSFYAAGGFEYNYQEPFHSLTDLNGLDKWQQSGLVGVSKVLSFKSKFFKKTQLKLLWDFLSYQQIPRGQALKFRVAIISR